MGIKFIIPDWPAPHRVRSLITTREFGTSGGRYASFNLATHVGDDFDSVIKNRRELVRNIGRQISWLSQVHGIGVVRLEKTTKMTYRSDAAVAVSRGLVCAVLTADCLPILLCSASGDKVAAIHAGWRGLANGVIDAAVAAMSGGSERLMAYVGPSISQSHFEVGADVIDMFSLAGWADLEKHYKISVSKEGKFYLDLFSLAKYNLRRLGVADVYGGDLCTYSDSRFYSHRRDGNTGRFASLIWLD